MTPWLLLTLFAALTWMALGMWAWWLNQRARQRDLAHAAEIRMALQSTDQRVIDLVGELRDLKAHLEQSAPPAPEVWTGVILPTDETNAAVERHLKTAEDHAIAGQEPLRGSSPPSRRSAETWRRATSTPPARRSGNG